MGEALTVAGTIVQCRGDAKYSGQYVKTYTVKTSLDGKNFQAVSGGAYDGKYKGTAKNLFHSGGKRKARYVRFYVQTWGKEHPSMRADVLVVEKKGPSAGINAIDTPATDGITCGDCP